MGKLGSDRGNRKVEGAGEQGVGNYGKGWLVQTGEKEIKRSVM